MWKTEFRREDKKGLWKSINQYISNNVSLINELFKKGTIFPKGFVLELQDGDITATIIDVHLSVTLHEAVIVYDLDGKFEDTAE